MKDPILDLPTAAVASGVGRSTLHRWIKKRLIVPVDRDPTTLRLSDVERVRDEQRAAQRAGLENYNRVRQTLR